MASSRETTWALALGAFSPDSAESGLSPGLSPGLPGWSSAMRSFTASDFFLSPAPAEAEGLAGLPALAGDPAGAAGVVSCAKLGDSQPASTTKDATPRPVACPEIFLNLLMN